MNVNAIEFLNKNGERNDHEHMERASLVVTSSTYSGTLRSKERMYSFDRVSAVTL